MKKSALLAAAACMSLAFFGTQARAQDGPPAFELHVWGGNEASDSSAFGLRSVEAAAWATRYDRFAVRYDNSLSLDNPALARAGVDAEAYFLSYLHDFHGEYILSGEIGARDLPGGIDQQIYKLEGVRLRDNRAAKLGLQMSPTDDPAGNFTDRVVYGSYNFPVSERWRLEPAVYLSQTGANKDDEWRVAGYAEYNAPSGWQLGLGAGYGQISSTLASANGDLTTAHARLSVPFMRHHLVHFQVRYEDSPLNEYTMGLVGFSLRVPRS